MMIIITEIMMTFRVSPGLFRTTLTRTIKNNITIVHFFNLARYIYIPCGTKFLREFIFCGLAIFCVLWKLIFAIRTDWFFLKEIVFGDFRKFPVPSIENIFVFIEY